ncbi:MAG: HEAT repeat domain-containing protein [Planctomycetes bacterium]|nr:HEAT repeat domain-containing protein [Planctomycetota bacterium]
MSERQAGSTRRRAAGQRPAGWLACVLAGALLAGAAAAAERPEAGDREIRSRLSSRFLREREDALAGLLARGPEAVPELLRLLSDEDHRVRDLAIRGLGQIGQTEARDALLARIGEEKDPRLLDGIARALVGYAPQTWPAVRARARAPEAGPAEQRVLERFLWEYVVHLIHRILGENTDASGEFKGFYDGQFEAVAAIGPEAADVLLRMVLDGERFPISVRQFAVRAMAEAGDASHIPVLRRFHDDLAGGMSPEDLFRSSDRDPERQLVIFARRVLARLGDSEPCRDRIAWLERRFTDFEGLLEQRAGYYQYELAYEWHQMRDYSRALEAYQRYLAHYPAEKLTLWNSRHYAWYNMSCIAAKLGHREQALEYLARAFDENYTDFLWLELDRDLDNIRGLPEYQALVRRQKARFLAPASGETPAGER